ncbi:LITAF domain-containing protein [Trichonephila clavipes]|nr:LITAF domain-containing protein [Trichonephila clavipes]
MPSINSSTFSDPEKYTSGKPLNSAASPTSGLGKLNLAGRHSILLKYNIQKTYLYFSDFFLKYLFGMAEKGQYQQVPPQVIPPPYGPADPPPAYTTGPYMPGEGYQAPPTVLLGAPTTAGGPPTVVTVVKVGQWGPYPMQVACPQCSARVMTETSASPGLLTWLLSGALVFVG